MDVNVNTVMPEPANESFDTPARSLSQWQLMRRAFTAHRLAVGATVVLLLLYLVAITAEFVAPYSPHHQYTQYTYVPPQLPKWVDQEGHFHLRPFVYGLKQERDPVTWEKRYTINPDEVRPLKFVVRGTPYKFLKLFETDLHLFGVDGDTPFFLFGTDHLGRDLFSRIVYGSRVSLSIGLIGVFLSLILGLLIGGISGLFGGWVDTVIQRFIEILISIPSLPLWMALSAALPSNWPPLKTYFAVTVLLSLLGWTGVARVVRGKFLALREDDFVQAAEGLGASTWWIITRHLVPNFMSYVLVNVTLSIPGMILGETSLSFLGIGLQPPVISWGVLLQQAQNMRTVALHPWLLLPALFVVITVMAFNFVGDGLRDAADPYSA